MILAAATQATPYSGLTSSDTSADLQSEPTQRIRVPPPPTATASGDLQDSITLSKEGLSRSRQEAAENDKKSAARGPGQQRDPAGGSGAPDQLSPEEQQTVVKLKQRDLEVKTHEAAHLANAGQYAAGGPSYSYQTGPDGKKYAVGGEVPIDIGKEKTPEQTVQKMRIVRRAALAPANPSAADRNIAAAASMAEAEAMQEMRSPENNSSDRKSEQNIGSTPQQPQDETGMRQSLNRRALQGFYA